MNIRLDLFLDYADNLKLYPAFQEHFRTSNHCYLQTGESVIHFSFLGCRGLPAR